MLTDLWLGLCTIQVLEKPKLAHMSLTPTSFFDLLRLLWSFERDLLLTWFRVNMISALMLLWGLCRWNSAYWAFYGKTSNKHPGVYSNNRQIGLPPAFSRVPACESSSSKSWVELSWAESVNWDVKLSISTFVTFTPPPAFNGDPACIGSFTGKSK